MGMLGLGIGIGLVCVGSGYGIGKLAASAVEGIARQPESAGDIRGAAIVLAALIEGFTFFALIVAIILGFFIWDNEGKAIEKDMNPYGAVGSVSVPQQVTVAESARRTIEAAPRGR